MCDLGINCMAYLPRDMIASRDYYHLTTSHYVTWLIISQYTCFTTCYKTPPYSLCHVINKVTSHITWLYTWSRVTIYVTWLKVSHETLLNHVLKSITILVSRDQWCDVSHVIDKPRYVTLDITWLLPYDWEHHVKPLCSFTWFIALTFYWLSRYHPFTCWLSLTLFFKF